MATYYKWEKLSPTFYGSQTELTNGVIADTTTDPNAILWIWNVDISDVINTGKAIVETKYGQIPSGQSLSGLNGTYAIFYGEKKETVTTYYHLLNDSSVGRYNTISNNSGEAKVVGKGSYSVYNYRKSYGYVYSTNPDAYPNDGVSGDYYYGPRSTILSPSAPSSISYPSSIETRDITISWNAATSAIPSYSISLYELSYSVNNGESWTVIGTQSGTSKSFSVPVTTRSIKFRVRAKDTNGQWGNYKTGANAQVVLYPKLTAPSVIMEGQEIDISWTKVEGASSYKLQRKADSGEWEQIYSGSLTSYTDTAEKWSTVQYQVCAVFSGTNGVFETSATINVLDDSALTISGQDEYLGEIISDVMYSVASNTGNNISLNVTVNGILFYSNSVKSPYIGEVHIFDLPTGTGTIVITASVQSSSDPVTVTRTWTYTKAAQTFPTSGGLAQLTQDGQNVFPLTLAEAVKAIGGPWGGNLSTALDKLARAATYSSQTLAKYTEVNVDLSTAKSGDIVNLPVKGVMVPHIVVQVGNPDPEMYDSSCEGVWLLRQDIVENGQWNSTNVNTLEGSTIMTTMQGYVTDYDSTVQAAIQTVKIPYCVGGSDTAVKTLENGLQCKMFPLSAQEIGCGDYPGTGSVPEDGAKLDYFPLGYANSTGKRLAKYNGTNSDWFTRSQLMSGNTNAWIINSGEGFTHKPVTNSAGIRNCFLLPITFTATYYVDTAGNVHADQEYTTAGDFYDLWGNVIPTVKIATGSYVGTGTYGADNPNEFIAGFPVKFACIISTATLLMAPQEGDYIGYTTAFIKTGGYTSGSCKQTYNGILWYGNNPETQMNYSGQKYYIFVIG